jgi:hypothetical protein
MKANKIILITTVLASTLLLANTCFEDGHGCITIVNRSHEKIIYQDWLESTETSFRCYDDRLPVIYGIQADSSRCSESFLNTWESSLDKGQILNVMIGSGDACDKYYKEPCDTFQKYVPVLHQYLLTLEDLNRMNWTIVYPPEE